ncbi:hypothetical protein PSN45_001557 [Yamadazyma tenuis]|uniref:Uncharacterized protein n=1 Tax=Candida tenuis (strain ATCC 10573 / BCRC 21748 / CBS 615 / JCM 9827 / NBRC 10315 / NRRL Y-1498 / VKM Y-70) TaxID=590646 RepID=G3BFE8_CANTC|nr:uncharacterized protein CANTEDRAFT_116727 [Yamadazyma tenuis ATCC 10573]EGV60671.1 hypothetical protein CANTEDRAFT_116727 [Yamadazyma tenuis ATCC 10573]WEJ94078.1 hypothetical protein PSN45_001557 [Yamadazyma tenuis]
MHQHSIYEVCNDQFVQNRIVDDSVKRRNIQGVSVKNHTVVVDLDKYRDPLEDILRTKGVYVSPDEMFRSSPNMVVDVPFQSREEFEDLELPDSELLKVLHYYVSNRSANQGWRLEKKLDETALLAFGMLVEKWADDIVDENVARMFIEQQTRDNKRLPVDGDEVEDETAQDAEVVQEALRAYE